MLIRTLFLVSSIFCSSLLFGKSNIDEWFDKMNIIKTTNSADVVIDNSLGVNFLGGTGVVRTKVIDTNPVHIQLPQFSAGCGGISYSAGALNLITGKDLIETGKAILSNAATYAFELALHTATPIVAAQMGHLQDYANQFNAININSCQLGRNLVNAAWPNTEGASDYICQHASENVLFNDLIETRHKCSKNNGQNEVKAEAVNKVQQSSDAVIEDYNLAWKIFNKIDFLKNNVDDMNMLLNLTGTIIHKSNNGGKPIVQVFPPKGRYIWKTILEGGEIPDAYFFVKENVKDKEGRISSKIDRVQAGIKEEAWKITKDEAWALKFLKAMESLQQKIKSGRSSKGGKYEISAKEKGLLQGNKLPIGSLLVINSRKSGDGKLKGLSEYAYLEAFRRLFDFFSEALFKIRETALSLKPSQISGASQKEIDDFLSQIERIHTKLIEEGRSVQARINEAEQFEKFIREKENYQRTIEVDL